MIGQSCVNKDGGCSTLSLSEESACRFLFWAFFTRRRKRNRKVYMRVYSCVFVTVPRSLFAFAACFDVCFLMGYPRCPKDYGIPQGLCIGNISGFPRVSGLQLQTRLLRPLRPPCFFLICSVAALRWQSITSVKVKFVARQVEASVVIRATKLKFVAESRTRVYFSQHVASTCNMVFCCETSWPRRW